MHPFELVQAVLLEHTQTIFSQELQNVVLVLSVRILKQDHLNALLYVRIPVQLVGVVPRATSPYHTAHNAILALRAPSLHSER